MTGVQTCALPISAEVEAHLGGIGILVNNAGIAHPRKMDEITEAEWDEVLTINLKSNQAQTICGWPQTNRRRAASTVGKDSSREEVSQKP